VLVVRGEPGIGETAIVYAIDLAPDQEGDSDGWQ
jgi:hypothetical protein